MADEELERSLNLHENSCLSLARLSSACISTIEPEISYFSHFISPDSTYSRIGNDLSILTFLVVNSEFQHGLPTNQPQTSNNEGLQIGKKSI